MIGKLDLYRVLNVVSRNNSFSKAAEELYMTQSAVSQSILKLEKELEVHSLSVDVLESELALLDKKTKIAKHNKEQDLEKAKGNVSYLQSQIDILKKQNEEGVREKNE